MKQYIITVDNNNNILDKNGANTGAMLSTAFQYEEYDPKKHGESEATRLVALGVKPDDLLKMKACGII